MANLKEVVVTGMGTINPTGSSVAESWDSILQGSCGIRKITSDWDAGLPVTVAGYTKEDPSEFLEYTQARRLDRAQQMALIAFTEAWDDAGLTNFDPERLTVSLGAGLPGAASFQKAYDIVNSKGIDRLPPYFIPMTMPNGPASLLAMTSGALGSAQTIVSACASGAEAILNAFRLIQLNEADVVICGGVETPILRLTAAGFSSMKALSTDSDPLTASRPFDRSRNGFVLSEGSGIIIIESKEHAVARKAHIYAELLGGAVTSEGHHVVRPDPTGQGPYRTMLKALASADISPSDISHINAHATSTILGDLAEATAIERVFKNHTSNIITSATKSMTGHLIAAAGALESIFVIKSLEDNIAPPSINITEQDPEIKIRLASTLDCELPSKTVALSNSFGFGGHNVSLIFANA